MRVRALSSYKRLCKSVCTNESRGFLFAILSHWGHKYCWGCSVHSAYYLLHSIHVFLNEFSFPAHTSFHFSSPPFLKHFFQVSILSTDDALRLCSFFSRISDPNAVVLCWSVLGLLLRRRDETFIVSSTLRLLPSVSFSKFVGKVTVCPGTLPLS